MTTRDSAATANGRTSFFQRSIAFYLYFSLALGVPTDEANHEKNNALDNLESLALQQNRPSEFELSNANLRLMQDFDAINSGMLLTVIA